MSSLDLKWIIQSTGSIIARNLRPNIVDYKDFQLPKIRIKVIIKENEETFELLVGNEVESSLNPSWTISGLISTAASFQHLDAQAITVQVFEETAEGDAVIASDEFELNRLIDFKSPGGKKTAMFPINSILLEVDDCWYISEALYCRLYCVRSYYGDFLTLVNDDNDLYRNKSATAFSQTIAEERQKLSLLEDRVKDLWSQKQKSHFEILLNDKKSRIQLICEAIIAESEELEREEKLLEKEENVLRDCDIVRTQLDLCNNYSLKLPTTMQELKTAQLSLVQSMTLFEARQSKILHSLQLIYPIELQDSGSFAIRGLEVPLDMSLKDDEHIATALSYIAHLLVLVSKFLHISLRYQILFLGSRSMIQDQIAIGGGSMQSSGAATSAALTLPLFRKNIEKDRFDRAISWMKIDIEQLLTSRGKSYDQKRDILYNVANLFQCQNCPRLAM